MFCHYSLDDQRNVRNKLERKIIIIVVRTTHTRTTSIVNALFLDLNYSNTVLFIFFLFTEQSTIKTLRSVVKVQHWSTDNIVSGHSFMFIMEQVNIALESVVSMCHY